MAADQSEDAKWKEAAKCEQFQNAENFNNMDICSLEILKTRLAICLFGLPENLDKYSDSDNLSYKLYSKKQQNVVEKLSESILQHQKSSKKDKIYLSFVVVLGRKKKGTEKNFMDWVFKVPGKDGTNKIFIDRNGRVYQNWKDYLTNNTLPKATICFPVDGKYPEKGAPHVDYADTPSCSVAKDVLFGFDVATSVTTLVGCGIGTAALFVPMAAPVVWATLAVTAASGAYGAGRSIETLVDRGKHEETLSPLNSYARSAWLGATVPFFGIAAGTATAIAATARFANLGVQISQAGRVAINVTNGVNCVVHGICFTNDVYNIIETSINGDQVSLIQIFQCVASLLLFTNAVVSTYQARLILQSLSSKETAGGIENLYAKISQSKMTENGILVRPTNFLTPGTVSGFISIAIPWGGMMLKIPSDMCKSIEKIFQFLLANRNAEFTIIVSGLLPLLKALWEKLQHQSQKHAYEREWLSDLSGLCNTSKTASKRTETVKEETAKITIVNMNFSGEREQFQEIIQEMLEKEDISELEVLQYSQLLFQRLQEEVEEKEKEFQTMCKKNKMDEKELENILGITGERAQHFANVIMKSYRDFKIMALKQDCRRLIEKKGIQIPLYSSCGSSVSILYFHSIQKHGSIEEKYLKILEKAGIKTTSKIQFPSENSYFIELKDPKSEYKMAGVVNFEKSDFDMMGIIILVKKS
ncbi:hypothetical protein R5R35_003135 [Gryllus longicercus]|uniref:DUF4781 domain-containing protein n=1 Tax=Gryllus longicercus TaxID=2509291 RepID=A0AAN9V4F2_9ORTH